MPEPDNETPLVFISYSHDSPEHKAWVAGLAGALREHGVDAVLDQWDVEPGDDLVKFMERGVGESRRVLMICTEPYVTKANEGQGGVGYEAMVVTGELVADLGTNKFIPVVRQAAGSFLLPRSVSTRLAIDFGEDSSFNEKLEELVRSIHQAPRGPKPALGENPFISQVEPSQENNLTELAIDPGTIYEIALEIARSGDRVEWRRLIQHHRGKLHAGLPEYWTKYSVSRPQTEQQAADMMLDILGDYEVHFAMVMAGIESTNDRFALQAGFISDLINPPSWRHGGQVNITEIPISVGCVYNYLCGALYLSTEQIDLATTLARTTVSDRHGDNLLPVWRHNGLVAWPESLGRHSSQTFRFILGLWEEFPWLEKAFHSEREYQAAIGAYLMTLSVVELVAFIASGGRIEQLTINETNLEVPPLHLDLSDDVQHRAVDLITAIPNNLEQVWKSNNVSTEQLKQFWPTWIQLNVDWYKDAHRGTSRFGEGAIMEQIIQVF